MRLFLNLDQLLTFNFADLFRHRRSVAESLLGDIMLLEFTALGYSEDLVGVLFIFSVGVLVAETSVECAPERLALEHHRSF